MRALVLALALLAGLKIWAQDTLYKSAAEEALIAAYRDRAIEACRRLARKDARGQPVGPLAVNWASAASIKLVIGNSSLGVQIWDVDHPLWNARFKHLYLVLSGSDAAPSLACEYDIADNMAALGGA